MCRACGEEGRVSGERTVDGDEGTNTARRRPGQQLPVRHRHMYPAARGTDTPTMWQRRHRDGRLSPARG